MVPAHCASGVSLAAMARSVFVNWVTRAAMISSRRNNHKRRIRKEGRVWLRLFAYYDVSANTLYSALLSRIGPSIWSYAEVCRHAADAKAYSRTRKWV